MEPPRQKTVIALHGAGMGAWAWNALADALLPQPLETLTFPGHGRGGALLPSIESMADWVKEQMTGQDRNSVMLIGHSMGGLVALTAASHPAVHAVITLGTAADMPVNPAALVAARDDTPTAYGMAAKWGIDPQHENAESLRNFLIRDMQTVPDGAFYNDLAACANYRGETAARSLRKPALILSGAQDKMVKPEAVRALAALIPGAVFHEFDSCGHMIMLEKPAETARKITEFLASIFD